LGIILKTTPADIALLLRLQYAHFLAGNRVRIIGPAVFVKPSYKYAEATFGQHGFKVNGLVNL
jgi:hypothetical protein